MEAGGYQLVGQRGDEIVSGFPRVFRGRHNKPFKLTAGSVTHLADARAMSRARTARSLTPGC